MAILEFDEKKLTISQRYRSYFKITFHKLHDSFRNKNSFTSISGLLIKSSKFRLLHFHILQKNNHLFTVLMVLTVCFAILLMFHWKFNFDFENKLFQLFPWYLSW